jgi:hypothetical protein
MAKKHSKVKNTGILFELLVRQITSDIVSNRTTPANEIIEEFFKTGTELNKELQLYQTLVKDKFSKEKFADRFIDKVLESRRKLDNKKLKDEKYNLIKKINENYDINEFFKARVHDYKVYASVYKLFEDSIGNSIKPADSITSRATIMEHITNTKVSEESVRSKIMEEYKQLDNDIRILAYKSLIERFNEKYSVLDERQKSLLKHYINNVSNTSTLREYIDAELPKVKEEINSYLKLVDNKVIQIKLKEVALQVENFMKGSLVEDRHILMLMRYYQLIKELRRMKGKLDKE